jgi:hypothetical protein
MDEEAQLTDAIEPLRMETRSGSRRIVERRCWDKPEFLFARLAACVAPFVLRGRL